MTHFSALVVLALLNLLCVSNSYHTGFHVRAERNNWHPSPPHYPDYDGNYDSYERSQRQTLNFQSNQDSASDESNEFKTDNGFTWGDPEADDDFYVFDASRQLGHQVATSTIRTTTVAVPGMETTQSPCEDSCKTTFEYNPACGDDGRTYYNPARLSCAKICGRQVSLQHLGRCSVWPSDN